MDRRTLLKSAVAGAATPAALVAAPAAIEADHIAALLDRIEEYRQSVEDSARSHEYFAATSAGMIAIFDAADAIEEARAMAMEGS